MGLQTSRDSGHTHLSLRAFAECGLILSLMVSPQFQCHCPLFKKVPENVENPVFSVVKPRNAGMLTEILVFTLQ